MSESLPPKLNPREADELVRSVAQIAGADLKLKDIDIRLVRTYQQKRISEAKEGDGPETFRIYSRGQVA